MVCSNYIAAIMSQASFSNPDSENHADGKSQGAKRVPGISHPDAWEPGKSRIVRATGETAPLRWVLVDATEAAQEIADRHGARGYAGALLAETLSAALLLASRLKGPGTLQLRLKLTGDISLCAADATPMGLVRARIPHEELRRTGKFEPMILPRLLQVRKLDAEGNVRSDSMVEMSAVDVSTSLSYYLVQSEQVEAHMRVASQMTPDGERLLWCGGYLAECFPNADAAQRNQLRETVRELTQLDRFALRGDKGDRRGLDLAGLFAALHGSHQAQVHQTFSIEPFCPCTQAGVLKALASLEREELQSIRDSEKEVELHCEFCRKRYIATMEEIESLLQALDSDTDTDGAENS